MSSFEKSRTKKKMMKRETARKKRAKKTTRATRSDHRVRPVVRLSFALREHRHNKSRQVQLGNCFGEFMGKLVLVLLGDGVVANVLLKRSKAEGAGWMVIASGWA